MQGSAGVRALGLHTSIGRETATGRPLWAFCGVRAALSATTIPPYALTVTKLVHNRVPSVSNWSVTRSKSPTLVLWSCSGHSYVTRLTLWGGNFFCAKIAPALAETSQRPSAADVIRTVPAILQAIHKQQGYSCAEKKPSSTAATQLGEFGY